MAAYDGIVCVDNNRVNVAKFFYTGGYALVSGSPGFNAFRGLYSAGLRSASCLFTSSIVRFLLPVFALRNEMQIFFSILSPKIPRLPRPAWLFRSWKYLLSFARVGLPNSAAMGLPCLLLSLLSLLRCGAVCLALSASMLACAMCACAYAVLWYYVRLCPGLWCCALCSCCVLCMLCLYVCNIISLCYALLYGYIGYKNRACYRLNIWGGGVIFFSPTLSYYHVLKSNGVQTFIFLISFPFPIRG